jgi:hypothetical protein
VGPTVGEGRQAADALTHIDGRTGRDGGAAAITFLVYLLGQPRDAGNLQLTIAILDVVVLNALIGFAQESSDRATSASTKVGDIASPMKNSACGVASRGPLPSRQ